ncbi:hypothetical protein BCR42DRAFT_6317 [Absidia repens]|uniref:Cyclic nucleotide-binding domain-containing protein n=1 Tax=Absidia repens TaxID=90262 RepID=A0A1X2J0L8_9FUNG|nr:hypothetical protein BCR42DRAFT_6317 [Absidia repens]
MFEVGRLDAPLTFGSLPQFIMKSDFLKKLSATYSSIVGCKRHSIDKTTFNEIINPSSPTSKKKTKTALRFH